MGLEQLKTLVISNIIPKGVTILLCKYDDFVPLQYVESYRKNNVNVKYIDDLSIVTTRVDALFGDYTDDSNTLYVYSCDNLDLSETEISNIQIATKNVIVICTKVSDMVQSKLSDKIIVVPKLEKWQIEDLAYSMADGADPDDIEHLLKVCGNDVHRLYNELEKVSLFSEQERKSAVKDFIYDGIFNDLSHYNVFDISTAIVKRDVNTLKNVYSEINNIDCEPIGLVALLLKNFKDVITVQLSSNPSPEKCGMESKKFWAVKYSCGYYTKEQLIKIYEMLTSIDFQIKTGSISTSELIDYMITYIFSIT